MKKLFILGFIVLFLLALAGCIQVDTLIKVNPDGSGVIEETFLMNKAFVQQMKAMMEEVAKQMEEQIEQQADEQMSEGEKEGKPQHEKEAQKKPQSFDIFNETELKAKAGELGEGVTYLSGTKFVTDDYEGYKAVYAFKDIEKIRINQNPGEKVPSSPQQESPDAKKKEYITFIYTKGKPSELLIRLPSEKPEEKPGENSEKKSKDTPEDQTSAPPDDEQAQAMMAQMKGIFEGMKIAVAVEVEGKIIETNATYREGSKVTLMELDFGKLIEKAEDFKKFSQAQPETLEETKQFMKDIPGIKVELNEEIKIKFQ